MSVALGIAFGIALYTLCAVLLVLAVILWHERFGCWHDYCRGILTSDHDLMLGAIWPVSLPFMAAVIAINRIGKRIAQRESERRQVLAQREKEIAKAMREIGIK